MTQLVKTRLRVAVTTGEPAGVGPELCGALVHLNTKELLTQLKARVAPVNYPELPELELVLIGDKALLKERMALYGATEDLPDFDLNQAQDLSVLDIKLRAPQSPRAS